MGGRCSLGIAFGGPYKGQESCEEEYDSPIYTRLNEQEDGKRSDCLHTIVLMQWEGQADGLRYAKPRDQCSWRAEGVSIIRRQIRVATP